MRYAMLGTTQAIRDDGSTVPVGGARLRALLTALALRPGRPVPAASLIEEVWDGDPPADGPAALQALVGRLRRVLGREAVGSGEGGYWLVAARDDIDLYRFERLARAAAQAAPAEAATLYDEALALWRGEPLSSLPGSGPEAARWEALRLDARRGRLHAALALGEAERVLPELTALCAELPLDEPLQALRIRALRDAGRPAEALAAYDGVRRDLATRLGTTPGPALRMLHAALLTPVPPTPRATRPGPPRTAPPTGPGDAAPAGAGPGHDSESAAGPPGWPERPTPSGQPGPDAAADLPTGREAQAGADASAGAAPEASAPAASSGPASSGPGSGPGSEPGSGFTVPAEPDRPGRPTPSGQAGPGGPDAAAGLPAGREAQGGVDASAPAAFSGPGSGPTVPAEPDRPGWPGRPTPSGQAGPGGPDAAAGATPDASAPAAFSGPGSGFTVPAEPDRFGWPGRPTPSGQAGPDAAAGLPAGREAQGGVDASAPAAFSGPGSGFTVPAEPDRFRPAPSGDGMPRAAQPAATAGVPSGPDRADSGDSAWADRPGDRTPRTDPADGHTAGPDGSGAGYAAGPAGSDSGRAAGPGSTGSPYGSGAGRVPSGAGAGAGNLRMRLTTFVGREEDIRVIGDDLARSRLVTLLGPGGAGKTRLSQEAAEAHARAGRGTPDGLPAAPEQPSVDFAADGTGTGTGTGAPVPGGPGTDPGDPGLVPGGADGSGGYGGYGGPGGYGTGGPRPAAGTRAGATAPAGPGLAAGGSPAPAAARPATGGNGNRPAWADGVWFVELAPVDDPEDVPEAVLSALGARETKLRGGSAEEMRVLTERADSPLDRLAEHCARRRMLLILDNCEHVVDAAARLAEEVLARCPGVQILATSREPLGVSGETLRPVDPLPDPVALRLLDDRGAAARAGFTVDQDPAAAVEICRRLDGMPLAIELAAARLRLLTPRQIADRLDDRFRLLTGGSRTHLPRQQTLRAVVDWSWDLLDEPERAVLRRLSVFAGGCDLDAAEAVCTDAAEGLDAADLLGSLVDKSLVVAAPDAAGMRYRLLETVAEYASERLTEAGGDRDATERRHLTHYRELARTTEPLLRGHGQRAAADRIVTEYENLRTALRRAVAVQDAGEVLCLLHSLVWYWQMHDLRTELRHWSAAAAALGPDPFAEPVVPAEPVYGRVVDTPPPYEGELLTEAWRGIRIMCLAAQDQTDASWSSPEIRTQVDGMLAAYRPGLPQTCVAPGVLWIYAVMISGDPVLLREAIEQTVETARGLGYRWELASALQLRANVLANRADWAGDAARDAEESLAVFRELGDDWGCAEALSARAEAHEKHGEYGRAAEDFRAAIEHARRLGARAQVTVLQVRMAGTLVEDGHVEEAERLLTELLPTIQHVGNEARPAARMFLAGVYGRTGRTEEARAQLASLREEFSLGAYAVFDGFVLGTMAWLDNQEGTYEDALVLLRQAMESVRDPLALLMAPQLPAVYLLTAALSHAGLGGPQRAYEAARLIGAYHAQLPPRHFPVTTERADLERAEGLARAELGGAAYEAAYAEGGGLTLEEATALI